MTHSYLAYSHNPHTRFQSTSGGLGSELVYYMFSTKRIRSAIVLGRDAESPYYSPRLISSAATYVPTGSVYHNVDLLRFVKQNLSDIASPVLCFALPCQTDALKDLFSKHHIENFIVELTCSAQQQKSATTYLLSRLGHSEANISQIRYRGDGWPSGVRICTKSGDKIELANWGSLWSEVFHSRLFVMPRCHLCDPMRQTTSDIILADPWGIVSPDNDNIGATLCLAKNNNTNALLQEMESKGAIHLEELDSLRFWQSQQSTLFQKYWRRSRGLCARILQRLLNSKKYLNFVKSRAWAFKIHCKCFTASTKVAIKLDKTLHPERYNQLIKHRNDLYNR